MFLLVPSHCVAIGINVSISLITGVNQQYEVVDSYATYEKALREGEGILRMLLTIDGLFIASYWLLGILVLALWQDNRRFWTLSVACISTTALLDIIENSEFVMFMEC